ncbi:MAG: hypothetical protein CBC48_17930 [bacterium TMED88]|nr:MAG: hypothetical protein CBC48_17930 [bacterium TMED88]
MFTLTGKCIEYDEEGSNTKKRKIDDVETSSQQRLKKIKELERKLEKNEYLLKKLKQDKLRLEAEEAAEQAGLAKKDWTMKRVKKIISSTSDHMMANDHDEIVKFISQSMITGKKLPKVKINAQGYAIPYLVRDILVEYLVDHCGTSFELKTPTYWMTVIGEAFKKLPFKFWDVDEKEVMKFRPVCDDEDGRLKTKVKNKEQLTAEQQVLLHSCSMTWNYTLPSSYGVFMLGMGIDFVDPINDILRPRGVLVYCSAAAFRCGSEYELCCGYGRPLDKLV